MTTLPATLAINAWSGEGGVTAPVGADAGKWGNRGTLPESAEDLGPPDVPDPWNWKHEEVGWGVVLAEPESGSWTAKQKAVAADAPDAIRKLIAERAVDYDHVPVLRYAPDLGFLADRVLRRYHPDGKMDPLKIGSGIGTRRKAIPKYLLIVGGPVTIPWRVQYQLSQRHAVGRLDLEPGAALDHYVNALLSDWEGMNPDQQQSVVWATDAGVDGDITREMRQTISHPIFEKLNGDTEISVAYMGLGAPDGDATVACLVQNLENRRPGLIVSTSHGKTGPLDDLQKMGEHLGLPVDDTHQAVSISAITSAWSPSGSIWYAHACCSAGSDSGTSYKGLLEPGWNAQRIVEGVGKLGSRVSPLPTALLGSEQPLRAFVGQVEPTFDWTLRFEHTGQRVTTDLEKAMWRKLYQPWPIGLALQAYHASVGLLYSEWANLHTAINSGQNDLRPDAIRTRLSAIDRQSLVILGDPTVMLPPLPSRA